MVCDDDPRCAMCDFDIHFECADAEITIDELIKINPAHWIVSEYNYFKDKNELDEFNQGDYKIVLCGKCSLIVKKYCTHCKLMGVNIVKCNTCKESTCVSCQLNDYCFKCILQNGKARKLLLDNRELIF